MRYFIYLAILAVMLSVTGCSNKTGSLTGKINETADSIKKDGANTLNNLTEETRNMTDDMTDMADMTDNSETMDNYDNKKDITRKEYQNDLFVGEQYSQESTDMGVDSRGYESINGISAYVGDTAEKIKDSASSSRDESYIPPYGYGMKGAENIIGNDKKAKRR